MPISAPMGMSPLSVARRGMRDEPVLDEPVAEVAMAAAVSRDALAQMIENVDKNHAAAHVRIREDFKRFEEELDKRYQLLYDGYMTNKAKIAEIEKTPIDATKLVLGTKVIVALVVLVLGVAAAVWSLRSGMDRLADKMEATAKLQDVQTVGLKTSVDDMKRRQELQQYEIQGLKEAILTGKGRVAR